MHMNKIIVSLVGVVALAGVALGMYYAVSAGIFSPAPREEIVYVLESVKDGTYTGTLPSLDHRIGPSTLPEEARAAFDAKARENQQRLARVPYDGNEWMNLALHYKSGNDTKAAEEVWNFIVAVTPSNVTAINNLGRLYHYDYKDFPKAEEFFRQALAANPDRPEAYIELFDLYRYSYKKDTTAAVDILTEAAERFSDSPNYHALLGVYYRDAGRTGLARIHFEKALSIARKIGDLNSVSTLTSELSRL
ncbi:tetratricopeptide repeat protein [Patescibacteria group bacterium]|nr:tetratricopeptide repeat protein [Patescibacteria group bacterium]